MSRDYGSLTLHDLPDHEADAIRENAWTAAHPGCEGCGRMICADEDCGCMAPIAVADPVEPALKFCPKCGGERGIEWGDAS